MKILFLDIETIPHEGFVWGQWNNNLSLNQLKTPGKMVSFAAKWYKQSKTHWYSIRDGDMIGAAWQLLDEADVVVTFNGKKFDIPILNQEFVAADLVPPSPYKQVDLCEAVKKKFRLFSNKLQYVAEWLGVGSKETTGGFELWLGVMADDPKAWAKMKKYNIQDVVILEPIYDRLLPWLPNHPNRMLYSSGAECPRCEGGTLHKRGFAYTAQGKFQSYRCGQCASSFRATVKVEGVQIVEEK